MLGGPVNLPLSLLLLCLQFEESRAFWPFTSKRFTRNSLIDNGALGIDSTHRVLAFGDFNGDQFLDIVTLSSDQRSFSVYLWSHDTFKFDLSFSHTQDRPVHNIVPSDFNRDGKLDLLVMTQDVPRQRTFMSLYLALETGGFNTSPIDIPSSTASQPVPLDMNGDMKVDLLAVDPSSKQVKVWKNQWNGSSTPSSFFEIQDPTFTGDTPPCIPADPHSNAIIDLNGDCLADIFLLCASPSLAFPVQTYQIWLNNKSSGFSLAATGSLPTNSGQVTFADMDRDGTMDMVFPSCTSVGRTTGVGDDCFIGVVYNRQRHLCKAPSFGGVKDKDCREPDKLCEADGGFEFKFDSTDPNSYERIPIKSLFPDLKSAGLLLYDTSFNPPTPQAIKLGDANLDGFPDLLFIMTGNPHGGFLGVGEKEDQVPVLALSTPCLKGLPGCDAQGRGKRGYVALHQNAEALSKIKDAATVSFIDMDEDGTLDLLVQRTGKQGAESLSFIQNNFFFDAFFLKAIVLNGACGNGLCTTGNGSSTYAPFGVSYPGASYKYTILDTNGQRSAAQAGQLPQSSYQSLQTPYSFIGLGRTTNYIENLFVGSTIHSEQHYINMEGVIPNSKVVFKPPPMVEGKQVGSWKKELYLRPGAWIPWVTVAVIGTMFILSLIVFVLHLSEKREDERERRRISHMINFDAL